MQLVACFINPDKEAARVNVWMGGRRQHQQRAFTHTLLTSTAPYLSGAQLLVGFEQGIVLCLFLVTDLLQLANQHCLALLLITHAAAVVLLRGTGSEPGKPERWPASRFA